MASCVQITTTVANKNDADRIADELIDKKLAACVQIIGPIESVYIWKKKKEKASEFLLLIKTREDLFLDIELLFKKIHPYKTPEILAFPISHGNRDYLDWIEVNT